VWMAPAVQEVMLRVVQGVARAARFAVAKHTRARDLGLRIWRMSVYGSLAAAIRPMVGTRA
jgi:hypothetical protein